jgi:predicted RecA/RadA family phage recombinase
MANNIVQCGDVMDWMNPGADVSSGDIVVIGSNGDALLGIALVDIANGKSGSVQVDEGVFIAPKVSGAVIAAGEYVMWDASAGAFDDNQATPAAGDVSDCAIAFGAAGDGDTTVQIKLIGKPGVLA